MIELCVSILFGLTALVSLAVIMQSLVEGCQAWRVLRVKRDHRQQPACARITVIELQVGATPLPVWPTMAHGRACVRLRPRVRRQPWPVAA